MKTTLAAVLMAALVVPAFAQSSHYVRPHVTRNGDYVEGHYQSNPDSTRLNNYSTQGNINPYTGQADTVNPYAQPNFGSVRPVQPMQPIQPLQPMQPFQPLRPYQ